ncbi:putative procollagen-proline 4-dioxygenase [Helianthus anomalus]
MSTIRLFSVLILLVLEVHSIPSYFPNIHYDLSSVVHRITGRSDGRVDRSVEMISWEPRAGIYHNFLVSIVFVSFVFSFLYVYC